MKNTEELLTEIMQSTEIKGFLQDNEDSIPNLSLTEYFDMLMKKKHLARKDVINKSQLNYTYGYQILNGTRKPTKDKLIQICFGLGATVKEANRILILADAGGLYSKNRRDCIVMFALNKKLSVQELNELLFELNERIIEL